MSGITELETLVTSMSPKLNKGDFVFCTTRRPLAEMMTLEPIATFCEQEGNTLILTADAADTAKLNYEGLFKQITLSVHSSLQAVGLTAAVSRKLTEKNISANVVAAYYHDHIFVPKEKSSEAMLALKELVNEKQRVSD